MSVCALLRSHVTHALVPSAYLGCERHFLCYSAGDMFPSDYNMSIINAQHGSWDRNVPLGYRVMVLNLGEDGLAQNYSALAEGWLLPNGTVWGKSNRFCSSVIVHTPRSSLSSA